MSFLVESCSYAVKPQSKLVRNATKTSSSKQCSLTTKCELQNMCPAQMMIIEPDLN